MKHTGFLEENNKFLGVANILKVRFTKMDQQHSELNNKISTKKKQPQWDSGSASACFPPEFWDLDGKTLRDIEHLMLPRLSMWAWTTEGVLVARDA